MGVLEELPDDSGACPNCGKVAFTKCTGCKQVIRFLILFKNSKFTIFTNIRSSHKILDFMLASTKLS
jgi:hypothetical protein